MEIIYQWMRNILIFIIAVTVLFQLIEKTSYRKYAGFVTGMILILLIVKPLLSVSGKDQGFWYLLESYDYLFEVEDNSEALIGAQDTRNSIILEEYKEVLKKQTERLLNQKGLTILSMDAEFEDSLSKANYGALKSLQVIAGYQKDSSKTKEERKVAIDKIVVEIGEKKKEKSNSSELSPLALSTKNLLADFYNLDAQHIHITIQEDGNG